MSMEPEVYLADILALAGGRVVSRIRMQKIAYLLDQLGIKSGFKYTYHHYGPYSRELDSAILDAKAFGYISEKYESRKSDGARYSIFLAQKNHDLSFYSDEDRVRSVVKRLNSESITVLELAATAHWLVNSESEEKWRDEIKRRKGPKTEEGRLDQAIKLLNELGLPPGATNNSLAV